jgi:TetR/AcrR family transcriptional regulator, mexJK operon transcriptional repressor
MTQLSDLKRDAILEAGTRMFLTHGYSTVSMDAIAEAAPVSKPTLYNYFAGKSALFEAVVNRLCARLLSALDRLETDASDLGTELRAMSRACVDLVYAPESLQLFRMIIAEQSSFPELGKVAYRSGADPIIQRIANYLKNVDPETGVHFPQVKESARLLLSMLMGDEHLRCLIGIKVTLTARERGALVERVVTHYLRAHHVRS